MGYTRAQIVLHWLIAALVLSQWLTHDAMEDAYSVVTDGIQSLPAFDSGSLLHVGGGVLVLVLILVRLGLRLKNGAPPAPADLTTPFRFLAKATHWAFYAVLALLPLSGAASILISEQAAGPHGFFFNVLLALLLLHIAGVVFHTVILRDGVVKRMLVPGSSAGSG
jgi:cytochrome b561